MKRIFKKRKRFRTTRRNAVLTLLSVTEVDGATGILESQSHEMQSLGETSQATISAKIYHK